LGKRRRKRSPSRTGIAVIVLSVVSLVALLLPGAWSDKLLSIAQIIAPLQDGVSLAARSVSTGLSGEAPGVSPAERDALQRGKEAAEHRAAALAARVDELEREVAVLSAARLWEPDGRRLGARGRLIPARVIAPDLVPWRSSRLVSAGSVHGVSPGDAVTSHFFTVDKGGESGLGEGLAVLLGEVFVGVVEQTATHQSRVSCSAT